MNKNQFLDVLKYYLKDFNKSDMEDILYDYEEHFRVGKEKGKSEYEIVEELGSPKDIANQYREASGMERIDDNSKQKSIGASIVSLIGLLLFNLIFVLGVYIGMAGCVIGLCAAAFAITFSGAAIMFVSIFGGLFSNYFILPDAVARIGIFFIGVGTVALGLLACIGMFYVVKFFAKVTVKYVKWNIKTIRG
ncbi:MULTISPECIES: HAAS signaling domain-containing protein [Clostridium]|uniref:HAAS signaling domain-containing protein n=1 Tax=Clostridium TaxID=1485 RepID=UPI000826AC20|nr:MULTISPECIES: DUF1700 domain-containing protein [Clostridium]PJI07779.1 DUF1700 domain-containing protein [Clostridium sp. CT7]